jgi:hypothetical protein
LELLFRFVVAQRMGTIILSAIVAHTGWHWILERADRLSQYRAQWPPWNAAFVAGILRYLMLAVFVAGVVWWVTGWIKRRRVEPIAHPVAGPPERRQQEL